MNIPTENQIKRVKNDWEKIAKETIEIEYCNGTFYGYGSELATLRIYKEYTLITKSEKVRQEYSKNLKTYFFALDI